MARKIPSRRSSPVRRRHSERVPRSGDLWTSAQAADALRVGVSSVKRWTDAGELEPVLTPGQHRRYTLASLHRFAAARKIPADRLPPAVEEGATIDELPSDDQSLFDALKRGDAAAVRRLVDPRTNGLAQRAAFLDRIVGDALRKVGEQWARGRLSIAEEHRASYLIADAIDRLRPSNPGGRLAILACPPDEWHELPLRLVRLVLEWHGWRTEFAGASLPWSEAASSARRQKASLLVFSARSPAAFENEAFEDLTRRCHECGTDVIVGGSWARGGTGAGVSYERFRTLHGFDRWLGRVERKR